ncbi:MAG: UvrD-helicase domain-containing protein, partial [Planctomycetes bacterium]|nr:UvrD-helicase domain-containing protein [Planctomycetota bacterium]
QFTIYDNEDRLSLIKAILKERNLDTTHFRPAAVGAEISRCKNENIQPEEASSSPGYFQRVVGSIYEIYLEKLRQNQALDFDDLLVQTWRLLRESRDVLERYRDRFHYILIDEYQDTNMIQYAMAKLLAGDRMNLCATGDPDQSIYSWRGASLRNILEFEKDFPGAKVIKLEQNYRSSGNILRAADALIVNNVMRKERSLWTESPAGEKLSIYSAMSEGDEAEFAVRTVAALRREGRRYSEIAIFYRTNAVSRAFERALSLNNIPYALVGGVEFYERKEIKDLMAYLKLLDNPKDSVSFFRVANTPPRSIGQRTLEKVAAIASKERCSPLEALRLICANVLLPARQTASLARFLSLYDELSAYTNGSAEGVLHQVIKRTEYMDYIRSFGGPGGSGGNAERVDNVDELIYAAGEYDRANRDGMLHGFLEETALIRGLDSWEESDDRIVLMTLHTAKGLEFNVVILAGVEEGLLPHAFSMDCEASLEEERRLFYVGLTRAREKIYISSSASRARSGSIQASAPSRFLREFPKDVIEQSSRFSMSAWSRSSSSPQQVEGQVLEYDMDVAPEFRKGDRVLHPYFGQGRVTQVQGTGSSARIKIRFDHQGEKLLHVQYAKLKKVL